MATFNKYDDPLVTCPYNPAHRVSKHKYQIHITKCRQNHVEVQKKTCPFNAKHLVAPEEYQSHLLSCPDRACIDRHIVRPSEDIFRGHTAVPPYNPNIEATENGEDWDNELQDGRYPGYDPATAGVKPLFRSVNGMKPAERRQYYRSLFSEPRDDIPVVNDQQDLSRGDCGSSKTAARQPQSASVALIQRTSSGLAQVGAGRGRIPVAEMLKRGVGRGQLPNLASGMNHGKGDGPEESTVSSQAFGIGRGSAPPL